MQTFSILRQSQLKIGLQLTTVSSGRPWILDTCGRLFSHNVDIGGTLFVVSSRFICFNIGSESSGISHVLDLFVQSLVVCVSIGSLHCSGLVTLFIPVMDVTLLIASLITKSVRLWWVLERKYYVIMLNKRFLRKCIIYLTYSSFKQLLTIMNFLTLQEV